MKIINKTAEITQVPSMICDVAIKRTGYGDNVDIYKMLMIRKKNNSTPAFYKAQLPRTPLYPYKTVYKCWKRIPQMKVIALLWGHSGESFFCFPNFI